MNWIYNRPHTKHTHTHTHRHTLGRTPLDERSDSRRDLYLTTHTIQKRQTSVPPAGFEPAVPASYRPQTYSLDRAATGINHCYVCRKNWIYARSHTKHTHTHTHTHRHTLGRTPLDERSTWQHATFKRDRHPCPRRDLNLQSQQAIGLRPTL